MADVISEVHPALIRAFHRNNPGALPPDQCWNWFASTTKGYGQVFAKVSATTKASMAAHRLAYLITFRRIPVGLVLDHLCRNRACINPFHLEPVTQSVNVRRGEAPEKTRQFNLAKTHCPSGHPYSGDNLYTIGNGYRACRACADRRRVEWKQRRGSACQN